MTRKPKPAAPPAVSVEHVPVTELHPHPANPRQGDVGAIVQSIQTNGWYGVIVAQASTRYVLAGNHRLQAAKHLKMPTVPVHWVDVDDAAAQRILLADNRANDLASYDDHALATLLASVMEDAGTLDGTLYDGDDLDNLVRTLTHTGSYDAAAEWDLTEFDQDNLKGAAKVIVHFATDADADAFFKLLGRDRTKSMWWPTDDGHVGATVKEEYVLRAPTPTT